MFSVIQVSLFVVFCLSVYVVSQISVDICLPVYVVSQICFDFCVPVYVVSHISVCCQSCKFCFCLPLYVVSHISFDFCLPACSDVCCQGSELEIRVSL